MDGPRRGVAEGADRVPLNRPREFLEHRDFTLVGIASFDPVKIIIIINYSIILVEYSVIRDEKIKRTAP